MDVALMLDMRAHHSLEQAHRFLWCDSSQIGEFDWLWGQYREIPRSAIVAICLAMQSLSQLVDVFADAQSAALDDGEG